MKKSTVVFLVICVPFLSVIAQVEKERNTLLDSIVVTAHRINQSLKTTADRGVLLNMEIMNEMPKILGNADPIHYAQMLPGIQTNGEYQGGIHIEGCENSHNYLSIAGVPIYNVNHLLGFFSTFNASHFSHLKLQKGATSAAFPNRLGGELVMEPYMQPLDSLNGELSVGLISSQGTVRMPIGKRTSLVLSLRASYLNSLYSKWLQIDNSRMRYSFYDTNATLLHKIDENNTLIVDFYDGNDNASFIESGDLSNISVRWGNSMGALHWLWKGKKRISMKHSVYHTRYVNKPIVHFNTLRIQLPSDIQDFGYRGNIRYKKMMGGMDLVYHHIHPQAPYVEGFPVRTSVNETQKSLEASLYADNIWSLGCNSTLTIGIRGNLYRIANHSIYLSGDPSIAFKYEQDNWQLSVNYLIRHQYLFQTGFSNMGLPTEFWLSCHRDLKPQYGHLASLSACTYLCEGKYKLTGDIYCRKLYHQIEYNSTILDFINTSYDLQKILLHGKGYNYGLSLMLSKRLGKLTGWISYSYTQARRRFNEIGYTDTYPASHERPHELNCVATYALKHHWSFGGTFVCASGTPFTAPLYFYLFNGNIVSQFDSHNSSRLKPYCRLDLSVNYKWRGLLCRENGLNLSLYNALGCKNELFYRLETNSRKEVAYRPISFIVKILPSISFFCKF